MPVGVVKTAEDEKHWAEAKKRAAEEGHAEDWGYIMGIFQRMSGKKSMVKAFIIPPAFRQVRIGGQVPSRENLEALRLANQKPEPFSVARLLAHDQPMLSVGGIVKGLGFNLTQASVLEKFLEKAMQSQNEIILRKTILEKCQQEKFDGALRQALLQRSLSCWREMRKSLVQVVTPDEILEKAKYKSKKRGAGGKWQYTYDEPGKDWKQEAAYHEKEIQNIKKRLKEKHGGVFNQYLGLGAKQANQLREQLERHRVAMASAQAKQKPTKAQLDEAVSKLSKANGYKKFTVYARDYDGSLEKILEKLKRTGNIGHSFSVVVDPDSQEFRETFGWDGDGADTIGKIQIEEIDERGFRKAEARGGKYYRRIPRPMGKGYRYIYDPKKYDSREDAHVDGEQASKAYLSSQVMKCILKSGKNGCDVAAFKSLVKKFGAKRVSDILQEQTNGGKLSFKKGRFYAPKSGKEESCQKKL